MNKVAWREGLRVTQMLSNGLWGTVVKVVDRQQRNRPKIVGAARFMLHVRWDHAPDRIEHVWARYAFTEGDVHPFHGKISER